jgi:predicted glycosyltransferase
VRSVLFCNEMLGLGHLRLSLAIAAALTSDDDGSTALVVTGSTAAGSWRLPSGVDVLKLPTLPVSSESRWGGTSFRPPAGLAVDAAEVSRLRAELSRAVVAELRPDVMVVDYRPLGRNEDLLPALEQMRASDGGAIALGLWDVDDAPERLLERWTDELLEAVRGLYDLALVYGSSPPGDVRVDGLRSVGVPVHNTGLVSAPPAPRPADDLGEGYLLATTGGGVDGFPLMHAIVGAIANEPLPVPAVLVTGPMMDPDEVHRLREQAVGHDVRVEVFRQDMDAVLAGAGAVVAMAGYCTTAEVLASGKPALFVPRVSPRTEQLNRVARLAEAGRVQMLHPDELGSELLREQIDALLARAPARAEALTGASDAARILTKAARSPRAVS